MIKTVEIPKRKKQKTYIVNAETSDSKTDRYTVESETAKDNLNFQG